MTTHVHLSGAVIVTPALAEPHHHLNAADTLTIVPPPPMPLSVGNKDRRRWRIPTCDGRRVALHYISNVNVASMRRRRSERLEDVTGDTFVLTMLMKFRGFELRDETR